MDAILSIVPPLKLSTRRDASRVSLSSTVELLLIVTKISTVSPFVIVYVLDVFVGTLLNLVIVYPVTSNLAEPPVVSGPSVAAKANALIPVRVIASAIHKIKPFFKIFLIFFPILIAYCCLIQLPEARYRSFRRLQSVRLSASQFGLRK